MKSCCLPGHLLASLSKASFGWFFALVVVTSGSSALAADEADDLTSTATTERKSEPTGAAQGSAEVESPSLPPVASVEKPQTAGHPYATGMIKLLQEEVIGALKRRGIYDRYTRFRSYAAATLRRSDRPYTGSELAGNCRLSWYERMLASPLTAVGEAEHFTRELHLALLDDHEGLAKAMVIAAEKLDLNKHRPCSPANADSPQQALEVIKQALCDAQVAYCEALAPLSKSEIRQLTTNSYPILVSQNRVGHTVQNRGTGRKLCQLMEKLDRNAMHRAAEALIPIADVQFLEQLKAIPVPEEGRPRVPGATGTIARRIDTPSGAIVIGGRERNVYRLDRMPGVNVVIDLGGDDVYYEGTASIRRPVMLVIDLGGNDAYEGTKPGVQGSAILGVSMLLDTEGNDVYRAKDVAQGSCLAGVGILIDYAGNDVYVGVRRVQGQAMGGVGMLIDRGGNDRYHGALWTQGMGGPLGFGVLDDLDGKDHYYTGGLFICSYIDDDKSPSPGYEGWGQGMGAGLRAVANGGIGVILDGGGDDVYEYDYLSHGGGYWCGTGFARDFGGNDQRLGPTRKAYAGGNRTQRRFTRFSNGFGCHYALGFLFDDEGNDTYNTTIMGVGYSWDCAVGYLCDFGGDDRYSGNEGMGAQAGIGTLFDYDGEDVYLGSQQGRASSGISYHNLPACGGNFSFVIDHGGTDKYGCRAKNNSYIQRGSSGGFLIDRPKQESATKTADKPSPRKTAGS